MSKSRKKGKRKSDPDSAICEQFRVGASQAYGKSVWKTLTKKATKKTWSGHELARQAGIDLSSVSKGRSRGSLSFPNLVSMMVALELKPRSLPLLPAPVVLAQSGYLSALEHVGQNELGMQAAYRLTMEDVECLRLSWLLPEYHLAREPERRRLAEQIVQQVGGKALRNSQSVGGSFEYLKRLRLDWNEAWKRTVVVIKGVVGWSQEVRS